MVLNNTSSLMSQQDKREDILIEIHFLAAVADIFSQFLVLFQKDEPLIQVLHPE